MDWVGLDGMQISVWGYSMSMLCGSNNELEFKFMTSTVCYYVKTGHEQCFGNMSEWVVMKNET